ncbi:MAG: FHA domain-containing protein [Myxococcota bacterium]
MITCSACGKQNQDHYRFCLGCGAELPRGKPSQPEATASPPAVVPAGGVAPAAAAIPGAHSSAHPGPGPTGASPSDEPPTVRADAAPGNAAGWAPNASPPAAAPNAVAPNAVAPNAGAPAGPAAPLAAATSDDVAPPPPEAAAVAVAANPPPPTALPPGACPECGYVNPPTNRFCASCGYRLDEVNKKVAPAAAAVVAPDEVQALLVALDPEGNEVGRHTLEPGEHRLGRASGGIFGADAYLSPQHAKFSFDGRTLQVADLDSLNGIFRKLLGDQEAALASGQRFRIGQELLQFDAIGPEEPDAHGVARQGAPAEGVIGRLSLVVGRSTAQPSFPVTERGIHLGRERGDLLFPEDGYVSGLHCTLIYDDGDVFVRDLGSSNGTFVQLVKETELRNGDVLLMGQQLYRVTI